MTAILAAVRWDLSIVLNCISLVMSEVDLFNTFIGHFCISSFENCLFISVANLLDIFISCLVFELFVYFRY